MYSHALELFVTAARETLNSATTFRSKVSEVDGEHVSVSPCCFSMVHIFL